jgi:hypothetical protein
MWSATPRQPGIEEGAGTDYRFRDRVDRAEVALRIADEVRGIRYPNFKSAAPDRARHDACAACWGNLYRGQEAKKPLKRIRNGQTIQVARPLPAGTSKVL